MIRYFRLEEEEEELKNALSVFVLCFFAAFLIVFPSSAQTGAALKEITTQKDGNRLVVQLRIDGTYTFESSILPSPPRFVVDISPVSRIQASPYLQIDNIGVLDIRAGQFKPDTARIVFDLSQTVPANSISKNADGLKVTFWYEGEVPPIQAPFKVATPVRPAVKERPRQETPEMPAGPGRSEFFVSARAGLSFFLKPDLAVQRSFELYGETGSLEETYTAGTAPAFELQVGKYIGGMKVGIGATMWTIKQPGAFAASLPHPYLLNSPRAVAFDNPDLKNPMWNIYAFALFSLVETEKISLSAGPMLGFTKGEFQSLDDFNFSERSPYEADDIVISDLTYVEDQYTELLFGGLLSLEYRLSPALSLVFDARMIYINPKIATLGQRANYLQFQPVLGIQFNF
jgi:hypothetical protein